LAFGLSFKLLLAFASTVIPGFSLLDIHDQVFFSPRHTRVSKLGLLINEEGIGLST
jgi:hypothetical protein